MFIRMYMLLLVSFSMFACQSVYEKQGDEHLAQGDGLSALQRYQLVMKEGKGSPEFESKLTKAYILGLKQTAEGQGDPEILLTYREKILALFPKVSDKSLEKLYVQTIASAAEMLHNVPGREFRALCLTFIEDTKRFSAPADIQRKLSWVASEIEKKEAALQEQMLKNQQAFSPPE